MIVFDLECRSGGHRFEGWFGSSEDFARQQERGLVTCPECGGGDVAKAPMAARLARKGNQIAPREPAAAKPVAPATSATPQAMTAPPPMAPPVPPHVLAMMHAVAARQAEALKQSTWVGDKFAEDARAMHYGDKDHAAIHGQATPDEARELIEEGIAIAPVLFPLAPPDEIN